MMKTVAAILAAGALSPALAWAQTPAESDVQAVSPALASYTREGLLGDVWKRPGLSPRDRSVVTLAILIAKSQTAGMPFYLNLALDHGVKPAEISEIITHLAFYAGWATAGAAAPVAMDVFGKRAIGADQLAKASPPQMLPLNEAAEASRATRVQSDFGAISPSLVNDTTNFLFKELWLRPDLSQRDRSLVTVSALLANGQSAQLTSHLNLGMNNGLTRAEIGEVISHSAFYAGWPNAFSAMTVAKAVFDARPQ